MKRHGNIFDDVARFESIRIAHRNAKKGKSDYKGVQMVESDKNFYLRELQKQLINKTFTTSNYEMFEIYEPKKRQIYKLPYFPDRIVHHAIMNGMQHIWDKIFIHDVYSSIPGKGIHDAMSRLDQFLSNKEKTKYCLQFDIAKFYPSVNHDIMMDQIKRKIKDPDLLWLLNDIVHSPSGDTGIPIGNYTSQYFANIYLNWFDHWIKQDLGLDYYIRYADDGLILHNSKDKLHEVWDKIRKYLDEKLDLKLNPKTQIYPVNDRGIDFLGYKTFRTHRLIRKRTKKKFKSKIREIKNNYGNINNQSIISSVMSYLGWMKYCDSYRLIKKYILKDQKLLRILNKTSKELEINNPLSQISSMINN